MAHLDIMNWELKTGPQTAADRALSQASPGHPHYTFGFIRSVQHPPPPLHSSVVAHVSSEVPQEDYSVPRWCPFWDPTLRLQEVQIPQTPVWCICTDLEPSSQEFAITWR